MFCKYCGSHIADDSIFCSKCGKKLGPRESPRLSKVVQTFRLKTPYPYFALLLVAFITWAAGPRQSRADYSHVKWSIEQDRKLDLRDDSLFQQSFSLVVENTGATAIQDIPVELTAKIEPQKNAEVIASFQARKLLIMQHGRPLPLVVVLADRIEPGSKKRYFLEGAIQAAPPFKLTYEVREEGQSLVLANYVVER
jgi:hypothetical protein